MLFVRPQFATPEAFVRHVETFLQADRMPWEPSTKAELEAVIEFFSEGLPEKIRHWLPSPSTLKLMGLPCWLGRQVKSFGELHKERTLVTLAEDDEFRAAFRHTFRESQT